VREKERRGTGEGGHVMHCVCDLVMLAFLSLFHFCTCLSLVRLPCDIMFFVFFSLSLSRKSSGMGVREQLRA
jgi:hypothetical protein